MRNINLKLKIYEKYPNQYDFSKVVDVSESKLSMVIHGRVELPDDQKEKWAKKLGAKTEEIFAD